MDSQSIGVSILFTSIAVGITLFWDYFFSWVVTDSRMAGYHHRVRRRQQHGHSCCLGQGIPEQQREKGCFLLDTAPPPPPTTVFGGFALSVRSCFSRVSIGRERSNITRISKKAHQQAAGNEQHRDEVLVSLGAVSLAGIFSKGIPILMSHVPSRQYQTWWLHLATAWMTVAVLGYMVFVLGGYLALIGVTWYKASRRTGTGGNNKQIRKELELKTDCIAGMVYYLMYARDDHHENHGHGGGQEGGGCGSNGRLRCSRGCCCSSR